MPLTLKGYIVHISCDGVEIPQYQVEVVNDRTVSCYIPSEAGKSFVIHYVDNNTDGHEGKSIYVHADGRYLQAFGTTAGVSGSISHQYDMSVVTRRAFRFSKVELVQDDTNRDIDDSSRTQTGLIEVSILRAISHLGPSPGSARKSHEADDGLHAPEKSKLIGFNHVSLGKQESYTPLEHKIHWTHPTDTQINPYVAFHFRHRPAELLQAMDIMPRPKVRTPEPSAPVPQRRARPSQEMNGRDKKRRRVTKYTTQRTSTGTRSRSPVVKDEEEMKPAIDLDEDSGDEDERRRALEATLRDVQSQLSSLSQGRRRRSGVKTERAPSPIHVGGTGEVIDLTEDC
ncbi:hypothetical protein OF83DRAFT_1146833 [Amylostereum chailletii]|nr:hypothetical protein OF83DRAFT_1146833 [Amylostereum chailletii]